jgi:hypothetical protein
VSEPTYAPRLNTGDDTDDDAQVIDSLLVEVDNPPEPLPDASVDPQRSRERPRKTGRLVPTNTVTMLPGWNAVQVAWADPDRSTLRLQVVGATATDFIRWSDDLSKLPADSSSVRVYASASGTRIDIDGHTGPLWVQPDAANNAAGVIVSCWGVSR